MNAFQKLTIMRCKAVIMPIFVILSLNLRSQVPEYSRQIIRSFRIGDAVTVDITNKYGKVQVINWDVDSVKFIIDLRIRAKDETKLQKLKQTIDFEFTPGQYYLVAQTKLGDSGSDVFKDIVDIAGTYLSSTNSVVINYKVMLPAHTPLKIENKFGDVYLDDLNESLSLTLSYGDLTCNRLGARSEIRITSGNAEVNYIKDGTLYLSYGNIHVRDAGRLIAETRSSNVTIDKSASLKINSRRDKLYLNDLVSLTGESYFSRISCGILHGEMSFTSRYGDIMLENIRRGFSQVNITSEYTDVSLGFEQPLSFNLELTHHQDVVFIYPKSLASLKTSVKIPENKIFLTSGAFGSGNPESEVVINSPRRCNITFSSR
jgi:hypothetical protein